MAANYDSRDVGVPYVRSSKQTIYWPDSDGGQPRVVIEQTMAVRLADQSVVTLHALPPITASLDFAHANDPIPMVHPDSGLPLGANTTLQNTMVAYLAVLRSLQNAAEAAANAAG